MERSGKSVVRNDHKRNCTQWLWYKVTAYDMQQKASEELSSLEGVRELSLKVALQILRRKIYKNTKKSSLYTQSLLFFTHKTTEVESHPTICEIRDLLLPRSIPVGTTVHFFFLHEQLAHLQTENRQTKLQT